MVENKETKKETIENQIKRSTTEKQQTEESAIVEKQSKEDIIIEQQTKEKKVSTNQSADYYALEENICDTIKEWQMKIGYRREKMQLFYKAQSLCSLLNLDLNTDAILLKRVLADFSKYSAKRLGECHFFCQGTRYCIEVPEQGTLYVKEKIKDSKFLKDFIDVVTKKNVTLEEILNIFASYSKDFIFEDKTKEDLGYVFFFQNDSIDKYVYCIEWDEFGTTYHRFTKKDYQIFVA